MLYRLFQGGLIVRYKIFENGVEINVIIADEAFVTEYCAANGYTYELCELPESEPVVDTEPTDTEVLNALLGVNE